ncbi:MAG: CinA family protein [Kiloniellales bacterium]
MFSSVLRERAETLLELYRKAGLTLATAESCTGGLIAGCLTEIAGSSDVVERGFVTYSNEAKSELLGVPRELIETVGAVSAEVAAAMAEGALRHSPADVAVSATGIAGPGGATAGKPVGLVYLGVCRRGPNAMPMAAESERHLFPGDRNAVREASVAAALELLARQSKHST